MATASEVEGCLRIAGDDLLLALRVQPRASRARIDGVESGRLGTRSSCMPAWTGVRPPLVLLHCTQHETMFSQSLRPPWATGTT